MKRNIIYYKITNEEENHNNYQYHDGLNILKEIFNGNPLKSCVGGGFYFTDIKHIFDFLDYGCNVREVSFPFSDPDFKMVQDPCKDKWRANKIIFGTKRSLFDINTFKLLIERGATLPNFYALEWTIKNNCADSFKLMINKTGYVPVGVYLLQLASKNGNFSIVEFLVDRKINFHENDEFALVFASKNGYLDIVKLLIKNGANIHIKDDYPLQIASEYDQLNIVEFLIESGANVDANYGRPLYVASNNNNLNIVKCLVQNGANIRNSTIQVALENDNTEISIFLKSERDKKINLH